MNIAFLFNSDDQKFHGSYGWKIRETIFSSEILQTSNRHMKISLGDVLILFHTRTKEEYINLCEKTYFWHKWNYVFADKLRATYLNATVFSWVIQNITADIAKQLHNFLAKDSSYLGMHEVDFSYQVHLTLYRNLMGPKYRIIGRTCNIFYSMASDDDKDDAEMTELHQLGFDHVEWEDYGARQTIFDDFDTLQHFQQVKDFQELIAPHLQGRENEASELVMLLEDLNPRLFNTLGAAIRTLQRAQNEEDFAQIGLSGRRYLEQLADVLFPPKNTLHKGREVAAEKYKNRLWAYIEEAVPLTDSKRIHKIEILGKEVDRLTNEVNSTLHTEPNRDKTMQALVDLAKLSVALLSLNLKNTRKPYYAFEQNILRLIQEITSKP